MSRRSLVEEAERRAAGIPISATGDMHLDRELRGFSVVRAIAFGAGLDVDAGREREISQEIARRSGRQFDGIAVPLAALRRQVEQRVITTAAPSGLPGGSLIQTTLDGEQYIDLLRAALRIREMGARYLTGLTGNVDVPRLAQAAAAGWVAENTALTPSDEGFDKVGLRPKHAGAIVEFSRNMLQQTTPAIEDLVRGDLAAVLARVLDAAAISGTGAANDPTGILKTSGIGAVAMGTDGGAITWPAVLALVESIEVGNVGDDQRGFLGNPKVKASAMQTPKVSGVALGFVMDEPDKMAGYGFASTNIVPSNGTKGTGTGLSSLIYGNWSDLLIGVWSELDILVNPFESTAYAKGNVQVRAMMTCDVQLRHPQSFAAITDLVAA
jgi:HK97 family phage major capsid protein